MHVPGVRNKVADCLSRYYENDTPEDKYGPYDYMRVDVRLDPELEDMMKLCSEELRALRPDEVSILACRVSDPREDRVIEAAELNAHSELLMDLGFDRTAIPLNEALLSREALRTSIEGSAGFLDEVEASYPQDAIFSKVITHPAAYPQFKEVAAMLYARNSAGNYCLAIPG
ncbi:hypothetical protein C8J57DRAFT_1499245 [Mycena rebaudengoi]|nr:hypothetical protein C8J57DRAFT_1499245 [Mycena rebaudengoi]